MLRDVTPADSPLLIALAVASGIFKPDEAEELLGGVLNDLHAGRLGQGHVAELWAESPEAPSTGWVYFSHVEKADGVWNLWWIGVDPARQKTGIGSALLRAVEQRVRTEGGRLLLIETSSLQAFEPVRGFYSRRGYINCGCIPDFYADEDGKVTFVKRLTKTDPSPNSHAGEIFSA